MRRPNHFSHQGIEIQRFSERIAKILALRLGFGFLGFGMSTVLHANQGSGLRLTLSLYQCRKLETR